ncbi:S-adenosyl-L-methionine-dependent methyltransferase [Mycena sp. CBHHK59/15]|nr:S-adenosyl-L-methionine-dependent methyltransferase [Mycena sp. CBHHK59/15]
MALDASPPLFPGLVGPLDRPVFRKSLPILAARFPATKIGSVRKAESMRRSVLDLPRLRTVVPDPADPAGDKLVLLKVSAEVDLPPHTLEFLKTESNGLVPYTLELDYDYWTADEIIQSILPETLRERSPTGFAITGHIAHVNLNDEYLQYKHLIGQILLDKNKAIRTVVNKLDSIDTQFRFFKMELLAGDPDYIVEHHESDCRFTFDFTQVYWNSRLHTEHERLKGCAVLANDLNPQSYKYLSLNIQDNRLTYAGTDVVRASCEDGRLFIREAAKRLIADPFPGYSGPKKSKNQENQERRKQRSVPKEDTSPLPPRARISHFVMNLPDSAITFLDAFRGLFASLDAEEVHKIYHTMPMIHCHCFTRETEPEGAKADVMKRVEEKIGQPIHEDVSLHLVRAVAPNKDMYCISFRLPVNVAFDNE